MKRTTYILFGMLVAGLVAVCGTIFYIASLGSSWEDSFVELKGDLVTRTLPACRFVQLSALPATPDGRPDDSSPFTVSFRGVPFTMQPTADSVPALTLASVLSDHLTTQVAGDTLCLTFLFSREDLADGLRHDGGWAKLRSLPMTLSLPAGVERVASSIESLDVVCQGFRRDSLALDMNNRLTVKDCTFAALSAQAVTLRFDSGRIGNLHLDLDRISDWSVQADSFSIDTEHLSSSRSSVNNLQPGECRRVLWTPRTNDASLQLTLHEAAEVLIE